MGTLLSLIDIPIMHSLVDDGQRWLAVHIMKQDPATLPPVESGDESQLEKGKETL
jgi:hypothetical protein